MVQPYISFQINCSMLILKGVIGYSRRIHLFVSFDLSWFLVVTHLSLVTSAYPSPGRLIWRNVPMFRSHIDDGFRRQSNLEITRENYELKLPRNLTNRMDIQL